MAETEPATPVLDAQDDADRSEAIAGRGRMDSVYSTPPIGGPMSPEIPQTITETEDASEVPDVPAPREDTEQEIALKGQVADLQSQLASLNSKLVKTFGRIGDLEDEVENANGITVGLRNKVNDLEVERVAWDRRLEGGLIVEKAHVQSELTLLMDRVIAETASRGKAEADKAKFEGELDELSASLFNEANRMVAAERIAKVIAERKSESLEERLKDTEVLMGGQSEQMKDLGNKLDSIERERDQLRNLLNSMEADPTVSGARQSIPTATFVNGESIPTIIASRPASPGSSSQPAFSLTHPMPSLMTDILPYHEFILYLRHLGRLKLQLDQPFLPGQNPGYSRSEHLANILNITSHTSQPFIKRCVEEDSDPCLRLDLAPGLNWLSRRNVQSAILEGQLIIEPTHNAPSTSCALCGTESLSSRPGLDRIPSQQGTMRKLIGATSWGFRSSSPSANTSTNRPANSQQVYIFRIDNTTNPASFLLCSNYCLERLRSTCEFWGAVRGVARAVVVDGKKLSEKKAAGAIGRGVPPALERKSEEGDNRRVTPVSTPEEQPKRSVPPLPVSSSEKKEEDVEIKPAASEEKVESSPPINEKDAATEESVPAEQPEKIDPAESTSTTEEKSSTENEKSEDVPTPPEVKLTSEESNEESTPVGPAVVPPPVPRRSGARPKINTTPSSSNLSSGQPPSAAQELATPVTPAAQPLSRQGSYMNLKQEDGRAWEVKQWDELIRIKEKLFWTRVGMQSPSRANV